jgi:glycopeptide antibiotics resistance protein
MKDTIIRVFNFTWPMIFIAAIILIILRTTWLFRNKRKIVLYRELLSLMFLMYVLLLFQVVTYQDVSFSGSNYQPLKEILRYRLGSTLFYKNVVGNLVMFIPFGFFITYYLKFKNIIPVLVISMITSVSIEATQLMIGRVFDIDDIILNVVGSILGYWIYHFIRSFINKCPKFLKNNVFFTIILIGVIVISIIYILGIFS